MRVWVVLALFAQLAFARAGHDVPVMLWCTNCSGDIINPLHKTSRNEFEDLLMERFVKARSPTIVFIKDNFCVEDVKRHQESLQRLNSSGSSMYLTYLTSVESALSVFTSLPYNTTVEEEVDVVNEGQLAIVPITDLNSLSERYSTIRDLSPNLVIAITGKSCTYSSVERIKRTADPDNNNTEVKKILFHVDEVYIKSSEMNKTKFIALGNETNRKPETDGKSYNLTLEYSNMGNEILPKITLKVNFNKSLGYFKFVGIEYTADNKPTLYLHSKSIIEFPSKFGYHCGQNSSVFSYRHINTSGVEVEVKLLNLQVQMDTEKFTEVYDCVGFMSIPIWTGIFVTVILALIMIWGLTMIMDIRTMDRFDDPKGKTITVSAQE